MNDILTTLQGHIETVAQIASVVQGLPAEAVREPEMPMFAFLDELSVIAVAIDEHFEALSAVGLTREMAAEFKLRLVCLISAQAIWQAEKSKGRTEAMTALIDKAEVFRDDLVAASVLALRHNIEGQRRLDAIREGESLPDLVDDLRNFSVLLTDASPLYQAIKMDVTETAQEASRLAEQLQAGLANEDVAKSLSNSKEIRDRVYTLAKESQREVRMFAGFAFRKDKTNNRRSLFVSDFQRLRNRRYRRNATQANGLVEQVE